jgi:hypothetical protein
MDSCANQFFKKFADAGFKTGVCIRPQDLTGVGTSNIAQTELADPVQIVQLLFSKLQYANKRWGCTLFYIDSNGDPNVPYDVSLFKALYEKMTAAHIKGLLIPEHRTLRYFAYTAPYAELRLGYVEPSALITAAYPKAFVCNYIPDGDVSTHHDALVKAVGDGEVLMFRGWWADSFNQDVKSIYNDESGGR